MTVSMPSSAASVAAAKPAGPPPTTTISHSARTALMRHIHPQLCDNETCLAIRHAINLHHAVETIANHAMRLTRSPPDGRRAKVFDSVYQKSGCDRIALISFHELSVECELNSIRRK